MEGKKDLRYFMRSNEPEIVTAPGLEGFKDDEGNIIPFEIKLLPYTEIEKIRKRYKHKEIATDKRGKPIVSDGQVAWKITSDGSKMVDHILVEALQVPNLKDEELMAFYGCVDFTEMPSRVFSKPKEYDEVINLVFSMLGIGDFSKENKDKDIEDAKN